MTLFQTITLTLIAVALLREVFVLLRGKARWPGWPIRVTTWLGAAIAISDQPWPAARVNRTRAECLLSLGSAYEFQNNLRRAEACYSEVVRLYPDSDQAEAMLGETLINEGDVQRGMAAWTKALELRPDWFELQHDLARLLLSLGNLEQAKLHLQVAQRLRPEDPDVRHELVQLAALEASSASSPFKLANPSDLHDKQHPDKSP